MSIRTIAIFDFRETLMMHGLDIMLMLSNMCVAFVTLMNISITSELISTLVPSMMYGIPRILKYDFN